MVQYYTLQEAAAKLKVTIDQLKEMAKHGELRAFQDRGNMRFRAQEVEELARLRGLGSDPDLPLSDAAGGPKSSPRAAAPAAPAATPDAGVFDFSLGNDDSDEVPLGQDLVAGPGSTPSRGRKSPAPHAGGPKTPGSRSGGPKSPPPASVDSDVRLVSEGSDLDVRIEEGGSKSGARSGPPKSGPQAGAQPDSGVRIVPLDQGSDSDVKMVPDGPASGGPKSGPRSGKAPSDSDVRLEPSGVKPPPKSDAYITEEIDLDAESARASDEGKTRAPRRGPQTMAGKGPTPADSGVSAKGPKSGGKKEPAKAKPDTSSDFELTPGATGSDKSPLLKGDDEVDLGGLTGAKGGSGINLQEPADSGISLEQGGSDEIEFELSREASSTPKPGGSAPDSQAPHDSSSDFELSLDGSSEAEAAAADSDSEFELSLDADGSSGVEQAADSDSEFELTLDGSGDLSGSDSASGSGDKDIFETDFDVPPLDEGSGSEAVALEEGDTDLEGSSDFDLALNEGDASSEEETGSQVVALEDEEADDSAETVARPRAKGGRRAAAALAEEEAVEEDLEGDLADEEAPAVVAAPAPPADWGVAAPVGALLTFVVLFFVSLMTFELVQSMWGYHTGGPVSGPVVKFFASKLDDTLPKD